MREPAFGVVVTVTRKSFDQHWRIHLAGLLLPTVTFYSSLVMLLPRRLLRHDSHDTYALKLLLTTLITSTNYVNAIPITSEAKGDDSTSNTRFEIWVRPVISYCYALLNEITATYRSRCHISGCRWLLFLQE